MLAGYGKDAMVSIMATSVVAASPRNDTTLYVAPLGDPDLPFSKITLMSNKNKFHPGAAWVLWCQQHADELPLPMKRVHDERVLDEGDVTVITFRGAHPNLRCWANERGLYVGLYWLGEFRGSFYDFDLETQQDDQGRWYCSACKIEAREYYASWHELLCAHVFSEWLTFIQKLFAPDVWVLYREMDDSAICDVVPASMIFGHRKRKIEKNTLMFRACADPQALNPNYIRPPRKENRFIASFIMCGASVTGIGIEEE